MDVEVRAVAAEEFEDLLRVDNVAFAGGPPGPERLEEMRRTAELDRTRAVFEGGRLVGASAALSFELTLPGLTTIPVAAITWVGVLPTHRRRGHLRRMMAALLDDAAARQEPVAVLLASESLIYGRFGYGLATTQVTVEIDSRRGALRPPYDGGVPGRIDLLDAEQAAKALPGLLDAARQRQPGDVRRPDVFWEGLFRDPEKDREGAGPLFYAVHESPAGEADGYAVYRVKMDWPHGSPRGRVLAAELVGLTPAAEAALLQFLCSIDLTDEVELGLRPADDHLRWTLVDPRRLRTTQVNDFLWARIIDPAAALAARRYP
ncbi:MAG: GNAT family N-acetyltransferase, partial [Acidimicrobiales bacterium]